MTNAKVGRFVGSPQLQGFVLGFRWIALAMGLWVTELNTIQSSGNPLPSFLSSYPHFLSAVIVLYTLGASIYAYRLTDQRFSIYLLLIADLVVGAALMYYFGAPYFLLALLLPVLETALYFGTTACIVSILVVAAFYVPLVGIQWLKLLTDPAISELLMAQLKIFLLASLLYIWIFGTAIGREEYVHRILEKAAHDQEMLFEELQNTKSEVKTIFNDMEQRSTLVAQLRQELADSRKSLDLAARQLSEARSQAQEQMAKTSQREKQLSETSSRKVDEVARRLQGMGQVLNTFQKVKLAPSQEETLLSLVENVLQLVPAQTALIFLLEAENGQNEYFAEVAAGPYSDFFHGYSLMPGEGAVGQVALMGKSLRIDRGQVIVQGNELTTLLTYEKSALIVPMVRDDRVVGIFYLGRVKENAFSAADQEALEAFCQLATVVVESARHLQHTIAHGLHDPLTGLHNRFYYLERLADELRRAKRYRLPLTLMLVKVDDFQPFRDAYGNEVADSAIKGVAEIVKSQTRDTDCLARLAEDFFAILLVQSVKSNAILIAERIRLGVEMRAHGRPGQKRTNITVSIGLASYPQDAHNREELMAASENALEEAKSQGGNHTSFP